MSVNACCKTAVDQQKDVFLLTLCSPDIVDIKPANMEELTEVITAAEFHPHQCNTFVYSSSKGTIRLCDMRASALCDKHSKCEYPLYISTSGGDLGTQGLCQLVDLNSSLTLFLMFLSTFFSLSSV